MGVLTMIAQLILSLSILVVLHEMGHFIPAKLFKTRVEKFFLFFDVKFALFKKKIGETVYGIGWLPLGGYVKIAGMIDESMDKEQMQLPPQPWEFRSKPAWQRLIIMVGGVTVNFLLGFFIFGMMLWGYGKEYIRNDKLVYGIYADSLGHKMGFLDGDKIFSIGGKEVKEFYPGLLRKEIVLNNAKQIFVIRNGVKVRMDIDSKWVQILSSNEYKDYVVVDYRLPFIVGSVEKGSPAAEADLHRGDSIFYVANRPTPYFNDAVKRLQENKGMPTRIGFVRLGEQMERTVNVDKNGKIGVGLKNVHQLGWTGIKEYSLAQAIPAGFTEGLEFMGDWFKGIAQLFRGHVKAKDSLGGFITITKLFDTSWNWQSFWRITAILSFILAIMNLLPIPALDGGHVMFLLWEVVTGKKPSDKFMEYATYVGFALVLGLLVFANGLDIMRLFGK
ncbi:MAG TPA: RIP metalloprotease RseP [Saprospiraceae bacterium]|nr:RIP metalloprotease RseP [Saprospiraceae bacterium]